MAGLLVLVGDALSAVGDALRTRRDGFDEYEAGDYLTAPTPAIAPADPRVALDELSDSQLLDVAATVIAGWSPLLLQVTRDATDVDLLVDALRDRAAQFAATE